MSKRPIRSNPARTCALRTAEQARQWLRENGISAAQFARDHDLSPNTVALGIKPTPRITTLSPKAARHG